MAKVELKDTLLGTDIIDVINLGCGLDNNFRCKITVNTKGVESYDKEIGKVDTIELEYLNRIDIIKNFIGAYTDNYIIYATMPAGQFVKFILSQRDLLECDMNIKMLDENGEIVEFTWKMRGFILDVGTNDKSDGLLNNMSIDELNNIGMLNIKLQLVYREIEAMRGGSVGIFAKNLKRDDYVYGLISNWQKTTNPLIDGEPLDMVFKYLETKETEELDNIDELLVSQNLVENEPEQGKILSRPNFLSFPDVFQKVYGLYKTGCNNYVHKPMKSELGEERGCIYSLYPTLPSKIKLGMLDKDGVIINDGILNVDEVRSEEKQLDKDEIVVLIGPTSDLLNNNPYVYGKKGTIVYIVPKPAGFKSTDVSKETTITSVSANFGTTPCDVNRAGVKASKDNTLVDNVKNTKQMNLVSSRPGEVANIRVVTSAKSTSILNLSAKELASRATSFSFEWQFGNPFIIKPYNTCTLKVLNKNNSILEYYGRITTLFFTYDFSTKHTSTIVTFSGFVSDLIQGEV